mgnify:CR=1 FL=1|jgi:hypothetical protein
MQKFVQNINRSERLGKTINFFSVRLAGYRGVPIMAGIALTLLSIPVWIVAVITGIKWLFVVGVLVLHLAIIIGFVGILLTEPLGRG